MLREGLPSKLVPFSSLVCVLVVAIILFLLRDRTYPGRFSSQVKQHRDIVAVIVQILSSGLAILQILVLCSLINFAARIRLFYGTLTLSSLSFWSALSVPRLDTALPWAKLIALASAVALGPILGAIWSGSLTPISTTAYVSGGNITIPIYPKGVRSTFTLESNGYVDLYCRFPVDGFNPNVLDKSTCPALDLASALMASARTATSLRPPHLHTKLDNNDWTYIGRSYGVGSSQGLFEPTGLSETGYTGYSYLEPGYTASATCKQTQYELLDFQFYGFETSTSPATAYAETITLASENISIPSYLVLTEADNQPFFAWAACPKCSFAADHLLVTYAYNNWYEGLGRKSCSITFQPTTFNVSVSVTNSTMTVVPMTEETTFDVDGTLAQLVVKDLDQFARTSSNMVISSLGTAINYNRLTINATQPNLTTDRLNEIAIEVFLESLLDDLLVARATEQMIISQNHTETSVQGSLPAVVIGTSIFHYAQVCHLHLAGRHL